MSNVEQEALNWVTRTIGELWPEEQQVEQCAEGLIAIAAANGATVEQLIDWLYVQQEAGGEPTGLNFARVAGAGNGL